MDIRLFALVHLLNIIVFLCETRLPLFFNGQTKTKCRNYLANYWALDALTRVQTTHLCYLPDTALQVPLEQLLHCRLATDNERAVGTTDTTISPARQKNVTRVDYWSWSDPRRHCSHDLSLSSTTFASVLPSSDADFAVLCPVYRCACLPRTLHNPASE